MDRSTAAILPSLKQAISSAPVFAIPDESLPYVVTTDASGFAVGATLSQDQGNGLQPIAFLSHKMNEHERNYPVHEQELLAVIIALKEWRHYLHGAHSKFSPIINLFAISPLNLIFHLAKFAGRNFCSSLILRSNTNRKLNIAADALSRREDYKPRSNHSSHQLDRIDRHRI